MYKTKKFTALFLVIAVLFSVFSFGIPAQAQDSQSPHKTKSSQAEKDFDLLLDELRQEFYRGPDSGPELDVVLIDDSRIIHEPQEFGEPEFLRGGSDREDHSLTRALGGPYVEGATDYFWAPIKPDGVRYKVEGTLAKQGDHVNIWVLDDVNYHSVMGNTHASDGQCILNSISNNTVLLNEMATNIDGIYERMTADFGAHAIQMYSGSTGVCGDIDQDGKINVLLYNIYGKPTPVGAPPAFTAGTFSYADFNSRDPYNGLDIFHVDIAQDFGYALASSSSESDHLLFYNVIAHEFQHMLFYMYFMLYYPNFTEFPPRETMLWLNESLSELAGALYTKEGVEAVLSTRINRAAQNPYTNPLSIMGYGDFLNFNNSQKSYGMSMLYSIWLQKKTNFTYATDFYTHFQTLLPPASNSNEYYENMYKIHAKREMPVIVGDALHDTGLTGSLSGWDAFKALFILFMENFAADGGDIITGAAPQQTLKFISSNSSDFNLWSYRPSAPLITSGGAISITGGHGTAPPEGTCQDMLYKLTGHSSITPVLKIAVGVDTNTGTQYYVAVPRGGEPPGQDGAYGADVYKLQAGTNHFINTGGKEAYLFVSTIYQNVNNSVVYSWQANMPSPVSVSVTMSPSSLTIPSAGSVTANAAAVVKDSGGNILSGQTVTWSINPSYTGASINSSGIASVSSNAASGAVTVRGTCGSVYGTATLTLSHPPPPVTITWNPDGGTVSPTSEQKTPGTTFGTLPTPVHPSGFLFDGWFTSPDGIGAPITSTSIVPSINTTYYAKWGNITFASAKPIYLNSPEIVNITAYNQKRYYIFTPPATGTYTFVSSNNTGDPYGVLYNSSRTYLTSNNDYSPPDQNFKITYTLTAGQSYYIEGWLYNLGTGDFTLTVLADTVTITWNPDGGTVSPTSEQKTPGTAIGSLPTPTHSSGALFEGWFTGPNGSGAQITSVSTVPNNNTTYYAKWGNTTFATAKSIYLNTPESISVTASSQKRYFIFTPPSTGSYTFTSSNNSGDPYGWLYNSSQTQLAYNDDYSGLGLNFKITYTLTAGQSYYIAAGCYGTGTGTYTLTVTADAPDLTETFTSPYPVFDADSNVNGHVPRNVGTSNTIIGLGTFRWVSSNPDCFTVTYDPSKPSNAMVDWNAVGVGTLINSNLAGSINFSNIMVVDPNNISAYRIPQGMAGLLLPSSSSMAQIDVKVKLGIDPNFNEVNYNPNTGKITWISDDTSVATVNATTGLVTAISANGATMIRGKFVDPWGLNHTIAYQVMIGNGIGSAPPSSSNFAETFPSPYPEFDGINNENGYVFRNVNTSFNATGLGTFRWESSNPDCFTVMYNPSSPSKATIDCIAVGGGTLINSSSAGAINFSNIMVVDPTNISAYRIPDGTGGMRLSSVNSSAPIDLKIVLGLSYSPPVEVTYDPATVIAHRGLINWYSDNESIAIVSGYGVVTAVGSGSTVIRGELTDPWGMPQTIAYLVVVG